MALLCKQRERATALKFEVVGMSPDGKNPHSGASFPWSLRRAHSPHRVCPTNSTLAAKRKSKASAVVAAVGRNNVCRPCRKGPGEDITSRATQVCSTKIEARIQEVARVVPRNNPVTPKWLGTRATLLHQIANGELCAGQRLPAEPELAGTLGVSRATLRDALRSLEDDGFLSRRPGAGTRVVAGPRLKHSLNNNFGVADVIRSMGMTPGTQSLEVHLLGASVEEAQDLKVDVGSPLVVVERVRTADQVPVVFSTSFYAAGDDHASVEQLQDIGEESLYQVLERLSGRAVQYGLGTIAPATAGARLASKLHVAAGTLLMHLRQVDCDEDWAPVMVSSEYYLSEAFEFKVVRRGTRATASSS